MSDHAAAPPVIIVHGLWMHGLAMGWLARRITRGGFDAQTWSYPSVRHSLSDNARHFAQYCRALNLPRFHVVAHSLGGLVSLRMLELAPDLHCERLVLVGTPYVDSEAARGLARWPGGTRLLGSSIGEWLEGLHPHPARGAVDIGVIAGTRGFGMGRLVAPDLKPPHDGAVRLAETQLPFPHQRIELPVGHSGMLLSDAVARQCCTFLRHGRFDVSGGRP